MGSDPSVADSLSLPFPFALDLRCAFDLEGLCFCFDSGTKSSTGSMSGRGLAGLPWLPLRLCRFQKLFADNGVPVVLSAEFLLTGVEKPSLA